MDARILHSLYLTMVILSLKDQTPNQQSENEDTGPLLLNAFDLIILSQGLNLASLFDRRKVFNCDISFIFAVTNMITIHTNIEKTVI